MNASQQINIFKPKLPDLEAIAPYIKRIDAQQHYSNFGPLNVEVEERIAKHMGVSKEQVATASNATLALQGALMTSKFGNFHWKVPSWTFTATACAAELSRVSYELVDVDYAGKLPTSRESGCYLDVCLFGGEVDYDRFPNADCVLIDAAASFDALEGIAFPARREPIGIALSLHATKTLPAGEGGVFISNDVQWVERFRAWTRFGMESGRVSSIIGTNAKLNEYNAAVALAALDAWPETKKLWIHLATKAKTISHEFGLQIASGIAYGLVSPYWILKFNSQEDKQALSEILLDARVDFRNWWEEGCHLMPAFNSKHGGDFPGTEIAAQRTLGLPFHLGLTDSDFQRIRECLRTWREARP